MDDAAARPARTTAVVAIAQGDDAGDAGLSVRRGDPPRGQGSAARGRLARASPPPRRVDVGAGREAAPVGSRAVRSAPRIAVVGSANIDLVARCERLPRPGETVTDALLERMPGGKGANQAVAASRLGARVSFVGRIGSDDLVLRSLERDGVDTSGVVRDEGESGIAFVLVEAG